MRVAAAMAADGDTVRIAVIDQGRGIAEADLARIFDPFCSTPADRGATGLGLSICRRIVLNHGGSIESDSVSGIGTEVVVTLPVGAPAEVPVPRGIASFASVA